MDSWVLNKGMDNYITLQTNKKSRMKYPCLLEEQWVTKNKLNEVANYTKHDKHRIYFNIRRRSEATYQEDLYSYGNYAKSGKLS